MRTISTIVSLVLVVALTAGQSNADDWRGVGAIKTKANFPDPVTLQSAALDGRERIRLSCATNIISQNNTGVPADESNCDGKEKYVSISEFSRGVDFANIESSLKEDISRGTALASVLDTRLPVDGKAQRISFDVATIEDEYAFGAAYVAKKGSFDMSLGYAVSDDEGLAKASVGFSW